MFYLFVISEKINCVYLFIGVEVYMFLINIEFILGSCINVVFGMSRIFN